MLYTLWQANAASKGVWHWPCAL